METDQINALVFVRLLEPQLRQEIRERARLSRAEVADAVGVTPETIWRWERGLRNPTGGKGRTYCRLVHALAARVIRTEEP